MEISQQITQKLIQDNFSSSTKRRKTKTTINDESERIVFVLYRSFGEHTKKKEIVQEFTYSIEITFVFNNQTNTGKTSCASKAAAA